MAPSSHSQTFRDPGLEPILEVCGRPGSSGSSCDDCLYNHVCCRPVIHSRPCDGLCKCKISKRGCILMSDATSVVVLLVALFFAIYSAGDGTTGSSEPWMEIQSQKNNSFKAIERHYISAPIAVAICRLESKIGWTCSRGQSDDAMNVIGRKSFDLFEEEGLRVTRLALSIGNACSILGIAVLLLYALPLARTNNDPRRGSRCINAMPNSALWATRTRYILFSATISVIASYFFAHRNYETYIIQEAKNSINELSAPFEIDVSEGVGLQLIIVSIVLGCFALLFSCCCVIFAGEGWHFKICSGSIDHGVNNSINSVDVDDDGLREALEAVERSIAEERARERLGISRTTIPTAQSEDTGIEMSLNPIRSAELRQMSLELARQRAQVEQREQELLARLRQHEQQNNSNLQQSKPLRQDDVGDPSS